MVFQRIFGKKFNNDVCYSFPNKKSYLIKNKDLENRGIIIGRNHSFLSGAAITLLLDNIATQEEITNILKTDAELKNDSIIENSTCEFCHKKRNKCHVCCLKKEMQMLLVNNAVVKLSYITLCNEQEFLENNLLGKYILNKKPLEKISEVKDEDNIYERDQDESQILARKNSMKKVKRRLSNMKKYYPDIYHYKGNVIEQWGTDTFFNSIKQDLIDVNKKKAKNVMWT